MAIPNSQQQYQLVRQTTGCRDLSILEGAYPIADRETLVPLPDGAGEVMAVGAGTTRVQVGDRVAATFFQDWAVGHPSAQTDANALGGALDGMLAQNIVSQL